MNTQDWSPLGWTSWISLQSKGLSRVFTNTRVQKYQFFGTQLPNTHPYMTTGKTVALTRQTFVGKVMSLLFNMLCRLVIAFLPRSKCLLMLWLQSPSAVILEPKEIKPVTVSIVSLFYLAWSFGTGCYDLSFLFVCLFSFFFFKFIYFNWRLITLQYCIGFAIHQHVSVTSIHVFPILNPPPSTLPVPSLWVISVHQPQASSIMHWTWTGDLFHIWYYICYNAILPNHPTLSLSHRVQKTVLYICVSFAASHTGLSLPSF